MDASYITSAQKAHQLPTYELPEVAFLGRSNCGKSSLLNSLTGRKNLARSSSTPGRTQMINFFSLNQNLILADLPGYGYNVAAKEVRKLWTELMAKYMQRSNIKEFLFLVDIRRDMEEFELAYMERLSKAKPVTLVFTKTDKLKSGQIRIRMKEAEKKLEEAPFEVGHITSISSLKKTGIIELRQRLLDYIEA